MSFLILLKNDKPDVLFLIIFIVGYFLFFLFIWVLRKAFKKTRNAKVIKKKESPLNQKNRITDFKKDQVHLKSGIFDYLIGVKDVAHLMSIRKKINNNEKISIPLHQAIYLLRHYPEYFYYAGEKQKILFEKINKKVFEPSSGFDNKKIHEQEKKSLKEIALNNDSKVLIDSNGIIQDFISAKEENQKIAKSILNDTSIMDEQEENAVEKKNNLEFEMKKFFQEKKSDEVIEQKSDEIKNSTEIPKPLNKKELKQKIKNEKTTKEDSGEKDTSKDPTEDETEMKNFIESILESAYKKEITDKPNKNQNAPEKKDKNEISKPKQKNQTITPNLIFINEKIKQEDFGKDVFLIENKLVLNKDFFKRFLDFEEQDFNKQEILLRSLIKKIEFDYQVQIFINQEVSGIFREKNIEGKFYLIYLSVDEIKNISELM